MSIEILMPALSPTMEEGTLAKWHVKAGDSVKAGDVIAEIETDKATMEVEAVDEGVIEALLVDAGTENVKVNAVIARLAGEGSASFATPAAPAPQDDNVSKIIRQPEEAAPAAVSKAAPAPTPAPTPKADGDRVFASPSNHRAHHAVNERYLDKNYGGLFILWDRLFGTFVEEDDSDPVVYGTRAPLRSFNPLWANLEVYAALWRDTWRTARWRDRLRLWFGKPGWRPEDLQRVDPKPAFDIGRPEYDPLASRSTTTYVTANFALLLLPAVHFLMSAGTMPLWQSAAYACALVASLVVLGALMEGQRWARTAEAVRWTLLAVGFAVAVALA